MEAPEAKVLAVAGTSATVSVDAAAVCQRCAAGRGCGAGLFGKRQQPAELVVNVPPGVVLKAGDRVRLDLVPAHLLRAAWLAYGLPLAGLLLGAILASRLFPSNELAAVLLAALGLLAGAWQGRRTLTRSGCLRHCVPTASERLPRLPNADPSRP